MGDRPADVFASLRSLYLSTFLESRDSIDEALVALEHERISAAFDSMLAQMQSYLASQSPGDLRSSVTTWVATLLGFGLSPRSALRSLVKVGDLIVGISRRSLEPGSHTDLFIREVARMNFGISREVVALYVEDVANSDAWGQDELGEH